MDAFIAAPCHAALAVPMRSLCSNCCSWSLSSPCSSWSACPRIRITSSARVTQAIGDILEIQVHVERYRSDNAALPPDLSAVGVSGKLDPWGRPYVYFNLEAAGKKGTGAARKNQKLVPINSDYDLYSVGKDGVSRPPLTAAESRDDVVRAYDGRFVDLASKYH